MDGEWITTGPLGDACAFSFFPTKNLGAFGDAGMTVANDDGTAERLRKLRPELPPLLITGYSGPAEEGPDLPRLDKPVRRAELAEAIRRPVEPESNRSPLKQG